MTFATTTSILRGNYKKKQWLVSDFFIPFIESEFWRCVLVVVMDYVQSNCFDAKLHIWYCWYVAVTLVDLWCNMVLLEWMNGESRSTLEDNGWLAVKAIGTYLLGTTLSPFHLQVIYKYKYKCKYDDSQRRQLVHAFLAQTFHLSHYK